MARWSLAVSALAGTLFIIAAPGVFADSNPSVPGFPEASQPVSASGSAGGQPAGATITNGAQSSSGTQVGAAALTSPGKGKSLAAGAWLDLVPWLLLALLIAALVFLMGFGAARRRRTAASPA